MYICKFYSSVYTVLQAVVLESKKLLIEEREAKVKISGLEYSQDLVVIQSLLLPNVLHAARLTHIDLTLF